MSKQGNDFISVEEELPEYDQDCEVIGNQYSFDNVRIHISKFSPVTGWHNLNHAFAWRQLSKNTVALINKYTKQKKEKDE